MGISRPLDGKRFGRLTVLSLSHVTSRRERYWLCLCDCGSEHVVSRGNLVNSQIMSCGCLRSELARSHLVTHGHARQQTSGVKRTYRIWKAMRKRCLNPNASNYARYGGRGIEVCERWSRYQNFLADMGESPDGRSIDRINNDGNYEPGNCRWATASEQRRNQRPHKTKRSSASPQPREEVHAD